MTLNSKIVCPAVYETTSFLSLVTSIIEVTFIPIISIPSYSICWWFWLLPSVPYPVVPCCLKIGPYIVDALISTIRHRSLEANVSGVMTQIRCVVVALVWALLNDVDRVGL